MGICVQIFQPTFKACRSLFSDYESEGEAGSTYDSSNNAVALGNPMDPSSEGATDFAGYTVAHGTEY